MKKMMFHVVVSLFVGVIAVGNLSAADGVKRASGEKVTSEAIPSPSSSDIFLSVGPGMAFQKGNTGWSLNAGGVRQLEPGSPIFIGADLALSMFSYSMFGAPSTGGTGLLVAPTAFYRFSFPSQTMFYPYLGLSVGPQFYFERGNGASNASVYFSALLRPGVFTKLTNQVALNLEPKFGVIGGDLVFLPQIQAVFTL